LRALRDGIIFSVDDFNIDAEFAGGGRGRGSLFALIVVVFRD
jgi:hypothetical protein